MLYRRGNMLRMWRSMLTLVALMATQRQPCSLLLRVQITGSRKVLS